MVEIPSPFSIVSRKKMISERKFQNRGYPMTSLTIRRPHDWHLHLRDGAMLEGVIGDTSRHFGRAIILPNLVPPVVTTADAIAYRERIVSAIPEGDKFEPLMTLY